MSEEILKALAQLYAIITKQDGGVTEAERNYVINSFRKKLDTERVQEYISLYDQQAGYGEHSEDQSATKTRKRTSVKDSVKTLSICKKINKTLSQKQKVIVLIELLELIYSDKNYTTQRKEIIDTVVDVFNISREEYKDIEAFVLTDMPDNLDSEDFLVINNQETKPSGPNTKHIYSPWLDGNLFFIRVQSVELYFTKYLGPDEIYLNHLKINEGDVTLFPHGSVLKNQKGASFFYSDIIGHYIKAQAELNISFRAEEVNFSFPGGEAGLRNINIAEEQGKLVGIMGASGAGKTTLLNLLAGLNTPDTGKVLLNGHDLHQEQEELKGVIGYIRQDDSLFEDLTVFENLYYTAKLCFRDYPKSKLNRIVHRVLNNLGLMPIKNLQVGSPLNKKISGGQRKRLNIALELIREPSVLFVDEPTSGLSSRDSENVIELLKELTLKGKLIFVVIHQPSSEIYKMFDRLIMLDTGGYQVFYGNPIEALTYFKQIARQADSEHGICSSCGNASPEEIFNILEERVVNEYGEFTDIRKITPEQWHEYFQENFPVPQIPDKKTSIPGSLKIPSLFRQLEIFFTRDFLAKLRNHQYLIINLLEAPVLAFVLAIIIRNSINPGGEEAYLFRHNDNIPAYLLMSIIVALFMGLTVSAEEIIKDRKILKREEFLHLSRQSYLFSKVLILFSISALQTLTFVVVGNTILGIKGMWVDYWLVLFSISCLANITGLNISSALDSSVTIYILIPLLLIPQMILSGSIFNFDKIHPTLKNRENVPLIADMMASRWGYEALAVNQFKNNAYFESLYPVERKKSLANTQIAHIIPRLQEELEHVHNHYLSNKKDHSDVQQHFRLLTHELKEQQLVRKVFNPDMLKQLNAEQFNTEVYNHLKEGLKKQKQFYENKFNEFRNTRDKVFQKVKRNYNGDINTFKANYHNKRLSEVVRNINAKKRIITHKNKIISKIDPVFRNAEDVNHPLDYRAHFYAPFKHFMGNYYNTYTFNILVIWLMSVFLYIALYYDLLRKAITGINTLANKNKS